jgi:hypothetical protein
MQHEPSTQLPAEQPQFSSTPQPLSNSWGPHAFAATLGGRLSQL